MVLRGFFHSLFPFKVYQILFIYNSRDSWTYNSAFTTLDNVVRVVSLGNVFSFFLKGRLYSIFNTRYSIPFEIYRQDYLRSHGLFKLRLDTTLD